TPAPCGEAAEMEKTAKGRRRQARAAPSLEQWEALRAAAAAKAARLRAMERAGALGPSVGLYALRLQADLAAGAWRRDAEEGLAADGAAQAAAKRGAKLLRRPAARVASEALQKAAKSLGKWGARMEALSIEERHEMRKKAKVLRYAVEFFGALYPEEAVKPYRRALKKLQASFGTLNDAADAEKLRELGARRALRPAIDAAISHAEARMEAEFPLALERWRILEATPLFWR
ncbi:MAG: CHAD domain-containing protein, partial [Pseudomonadota bacterium]